MVTGIERNVIRMLQAGHGFSKQEGRKLIAELGAEGRNVLRQIASGELAVEHPKLRANAIYALSEDSSEPEKSMAVLRELIKDRDPGLQMRVLRALARFNVKPLLDDLRRLLNEPETRADVALSAARLIAQHADDQMFSELSAFRERLLKLVPAETSPSIASFDRTIARAKGELQSSGEEPKSVS